MNIGKDRVIELLALEISQLKIDLAIERTANEELDREYRELKEAVDNEESDK